MTVAAIPSLLQGTLNELESKGTTHQPLFIEVGDHVVPIAMSRCIWLAQSMKPETRQNTPLASKPSILLLLPQEQLEHWLERPGSDFCDAFTCLSETQSPRADLSVLSDKSRVLATTPQRAIDHIRRDNIFLSATSTVVLAYDFIPLDEETEEELNLRACAYLDDCRFVFTKLSPGVHIELYAGSLSHLARTPRELVENPLVLPLAGWERPAQTLEYFTTASHATERMLDILYALQGHQYLIVHRTEAGWLALDKKLRATVPPIPALGLGFDRLSDLEFSSDLKADIVVAIGLNSGELVRMIRCMNEWKHSFRRIVAIIEPQTAQEIITSKETLLMNNETRSIPETGEVLSGKIQMLVAKLNIDSNPEELEMLKKTIRKNVPFHRRGYFAAYLLRELLFSGEKRSGGRQKVQNPEAAETEGKNKTARTRRNVEEKRGAREQQQETQQIPEGARTLYLNIGKMRRLYAKELSQILQDQLELTREDIYAIRVHDKYSFITLSQEHAEKAIEKLNGLEIRGRTASVSYSNKE